MYSLKLNPADPAKDAVLAVVYNGDHVIAQGGDIAISPDNIDVSRDYHRYHHLFGSDSWLFDVQAHAPTAAPRPNTVEDGQLLLMKRAGR